MPELKIEEKEVFGMVLGKVVARLREQRGLSQASLAALVGISQPVMSRIEAGKAQPDAYLFQRLAHALGTTVPALSAHIEEAMARTKRAAEAATQRPAETSAQAWSQAVAVAGIFGFLGLIGFAVAAALTSAESEQNSPGNPKPQPGPDGARQRSA